MASIPCAREVANRSRSKSGITARERISEILCDQLRIVAVFSRIESRGFRHLLAPLRGYLPSSILVDLRHLSRFSLRCPQCISLRELSNIRSTCRLSARSVPMRAIMVGPRAERYRFHAHGLLGTPQVVSAGSTFLLAASDAAA